MKTAKGFIMAANILTFFLIVPAFGGSAAFKDNIHDPGKLKPMAFPKGRFFSSIKKASFGISV